MFYQSILTLLALLAAPAIGQVQRYQNKFFINFDRVHSNTKMIPDYVIESHKNLSLRECVVKCYLNEDCQTINHNKDSLECEILNSTSLVTKNILERNSSWTFYEADITTKNDGPICMNLSPCPDSHVCVDTPEEPSQFKCKCVEGFQGPNCNDYTGHGRFQTSPAGSCHLLKMKYKDIPNGYYWLQKNNKVKRVFCNMHHDEGLGRSKKSAIASCQWLKEKTPDSITEFYWTVDNKTDNGIVVVSKKVCVFFVNQEVVGRWYTIYGTKFFGEFALVKDGTIRNKTDSMTLKPSKEKKIFPYSQGWMMFDHGTPSISDYFRYNPDDDTLEHFYFEKDASDTSSYKGLKNFVTSGKSMRKSMIGRWEAKYEGSTDAELIISDDRTGNTTEGYFSEIIPSDEKDVFPPTLGWKIFYYDKPLKPDYFRYKPEDDTLEHVYFIKDSSNQREYKGITGFIAVGKSTRKTMVGKWHVVYSFSSNNHKDLEIYDSGKIKTKHGTFKLIPSDNELVFPSYQGWMFFRYNPTMHEYICYDFKTDTIKHFFFSMTDSKSTIYEGLSGFSASGTSTRN